MNGSDAEETPDEVGFATGGHGQESGPQWVSSANAHPHWAGRLVIFAVIYSIAAKAFGWPLPNLGFKLFQGFLTEVSLVALVLIGFVAVRGIRLRLRQARDPEARSLARIGLSDLLHPGETLIWSGSPDPAFFRKHAWVQCLFGFFPFAMGLAVLATMASVMWGGHVRPVQAFAILIGILFTGIGFFAMATPLRYRRMTRQCHYGITDRRVLILRGIGWSATEDPGRLSASVLEIDPAAIRQRSRKKRSCMRVDLVFGLEPQQGLGGTAKFVEFGLLALRDWHEPEGVLDSRFGHEKRGVPVLAVPVAGFVAERPAIARILSAVLLTCLISPWLVIGGAMILAGVRAIAGPVPAPGLAIALPAGVFLTGAILGVLFRTLWVEPRRVIRRFDFDGIRLKFATIDEPEGEIELGEFRDVIEQRHRKGRAIRGWAIRRFDRPTLFLPGEASNGAELAKEIGRRIAYVDSADLLNMP